MEIRPLGDSAAVLVYKNSGYGQVADVIRLDYERIRAFGITGLVDMVLCVNSIGLYFDSEITNYDELCRVVGDALSVPRQVDTGIIISESGVVDIPVKYGGLMGPDLEHVASMLKLTPEEVVREHCGVTYNVYGIGFLPGFPYMGDLPDKLVLPRKTIPAPSVRQGSVAIAGRQTGIYPFNSPGGWHVIGWTPLKMFDLERTNPCLLETGYKVRFIPM